METRPLNHKEMCIILFYFIVHFKKKYFIQNFKLEKKVFVVQTLGNYLFNALIMKIIYFKFTTG